MSDFLLDGDGDLSLTEGAATKVTGQQAVAQRLVIRLKLFKGDWFLNLLEGVPYHEQVLPKRASPGVRREVFRRVIASLHGVKRVLALEVSIDGATRVLSVSGEVQLEDLTTLPFALTTALFDFGDPVLEGEAA